MFSFCRKSKPNTSSFTRKIRMSISSSIAEKLRREGFLQETYFLSHKLVFLHRHSVTSEMTSQHFPPFENEHTEFIKWGFFLLPRANTKHDVIKFKAWFFTLENGQLQCFLLQQQLFPQRKMPGVSFLSFLPEFSPEAHIRRAWKMKLHRVSSSIYKLPKDENIRVCTLHFVPEDYERDLIVSGIFSDKRYSSLF